MGVPFGITFTSLEPQNAANCAATPWRSAARENACAMMFPLCASTTSISKLASSSGLAPLPVASSDSPGVIGVPSSASGPHHDECVDVLGLQRLDVSLQRLGGGGVEMSVRDPRQGGAVMGNGLHREAARKVMGERGLHALVQVPVGDAQRGMRRQERRLAQRQGLADSRYHRDGVDARIVPDLGRRHDHLGLSAVDGNIDVMAAAAVTTAAATAMGLRRHGRQDCERGEQRRDCRFTHRLSPH